MILVITPNPAIDITYTLEHVELGETHRVHDVAERAGGKGLNVARVLGSLAEPVTVSGFLGGTIGTQLRGLLDAPDLDQQWIETPATTRRTVTAVADGNATAFNEAGAPVPAEAWQELATLVAETAGDGDVVVVSGSNPPGTEPEHVAAVLDAARRAGARTVVDTSGPLLLAAARAGADVLKPNAEELADATGTTDAVAGAVQLLDAGAGAVTVSLGHDGMAVVARGSDGELRMWRARPAARLSGNPTGAGDAVVAALSRALAHAAPGADLAATLSNALPDAVALSGAAVLRPVAGEVDLPAYQRMRAEITVES